MPQPKIACRTLLAAAGLLASGRAFAESPDGRVQVRIATDHGDILAALEVAKAPVTCAISLRYVDEAATTAQLLPRHPGAGGADGGPDRGRDRRPAQALSPIAHESTLMTGLRHQDGTLSMAREGRTRRPRTSSSARASPHTWTPTPAAPGDNAGYAAFGQVVQGMDAARAILALPTTGAARNPEMQGQMLDPPVRIVSMRRER